MCDCGRMRAWARANRDRTARQRAWGRRATTSVTGGMSSDLGTRACAPLTQREFEPAARMCDNRGAKNCVGRREQLRPRQVRGPRRQGPQGGRQPLECREGSACDRFNSVPGASSSSAEEAGTLPTDPPLPAAHHSLSTANLAKDDSISTEPWSPVHSMPLRVESASLRSSAALFLAYPIASCFSTVERT